MWIDVGRELGDLMAALVLAVSPQRIVVGGGVGYGQRWLLPRIHEATLTGLAGYVAAIDGSAIESLIACQPSAAIAPHYQAWRIDTADGRTLTGQLVHTHLDESYYVDAKGDRFKVLATYVAEITAAKGSIMPDGLVDALTDQEIRDLVAYLASLK